MLLEEAKENPNEWPSIFNSNKTNFSPGTLRKLSKIPIIARKMGETFFTSIENTYVDSIPMAPEPEPETSMKVTQENVCSEINIKEEEEDTKIVNRHSLSPDNIDMKKLLSRLTSSIERVYRTVMGDVSINTDALEISIELQKNNTIAPTHNCLFCQKLLKLSYETKDGKLKQFFTGNMKKHLIKMHVNKGFTSNS